MDTTPTPTDHEEVIAELKRLRDMALAGELTGFMGVLVMKDGSRKEFIGGTFSDEPPAVIESSRAVLQAILDGEDPTDGAVKH